jgi:hypothetical protein
VTARAARRAVAALSLSLAAPAAARAEPPQIDHQPAPCTLPGRAVSLCATITDDGQVAKAFLYFRPTGEKFYSYVDMEFGGLSFCGTLPAPREGKVKSIDYYVQAVDDTLESQRTSTYTLAVQPENACEFPAVEKDAARAQKVVVHLTNRKQGKKLPDGFVAAGVTVVAE